MTLIAITVFHKGKMDDLIAYCTEKEYNSYTMFGSPDINNECVVSLHFAKEYLSKNGKNLDEVLETLSKNAPAGLVGEWVYAKLLTISSLKEALDLVGSDFHQFIDDYAEHLKSL